MFFKNVPSVECDCSFENEKNCKISFFFQIIKFNLNITIIFRFRFIFKYTIHFKEVETLSTLIQNFFFSICVYKVNY